MLKNIYVYIYIERERRERDLWVMEQDCHIYIGCMNVCQFRDRFTVALLVFLFYGIPTLFESF